MQKRYVLQATSTATRLMAFAALFTLTALMPLTDEPGPAQVTEVVALANPDVTHGIPFYGEQEAVTDGDPQCLALDGLIQTIDEQLQRPGPEARRDELQDMRRRARDEQLRLLC